MLPLDNPTMERPDSQGFFLPCVLGELIRALPASCINLELDTNGCDRTFSENPHHVWQDLRKLLPRMWNTTYLQQNMFGG
jgi:hypothetical protein